jgi:chemotaxis signal transduction protein
MKSPNLSSRRVREPERVILFLVSGQLFAISAEAVQEIRSTDGLSGSAIEIESPESAKVRHMVERGHQVYYVVNACLHFGLPVTRPTLVLILRQVRVAVLVDRIERLDEISAVYALPRAFAGQERRWYRGLAYRDDRVIPVVDPRGFLESDDLERLDLIAKRQAELEGTGKT